jgi:hypothetical protein
MPLGALIEPGLPGARLCAGAAPCRRRMARYTIIEPACAARLGGAVWLWLDCAE